LSPPIQKCVNLNSLRHISMTDRDILATDTVRIILDFANSGYKFHLKSPHAMKYRYRQDHWKIRSCTRECYNPWFPGTMGYTRTFQPNTVDDAHTGMTLVVNNGKTFEARYVGPSNTGPTEMIVLTANFSLNSLESNNRDVLHLEFDTLSEDIDDPFTDTSHSPCHLTRTIAHCIPLRRASWIDFNKQCNALPIDWFNFLRPGISALSIFSKKLLDTSFPDLEEEWQWRMLSFETKWNLLLPFIDRFPDIQTP
jgi:hypothetical protein